jgi:hypothetical protein
MQRDPNATAGSKGGPISRSFAVVVLLALLGLIVLRHLFGSVRIEVGAR